MISIIVVAFANCGDFATPLISSIIEYEQDAEIILVDNASTDPFKASPFYKLLRLNKPVGYSRALNVGIENARGDWLMLLNDDCLCIGRFSRLMSGLSKDALYGINIRTKKPAWGCGEEINYLHGWIQVLHRGTYEKIGPFDENLRYFGMDDIDYGWRAEQIGVALSVVDFPFVHLDVHRRMKQAGFEQQMKESKEYFIRKVKENG